MMTAALIWSGYLAFPLLIIFGALRDLTRFTLPNWLSAALIAGFLLFATLIDMPLATLASHIGAGLLLLVIGFALFLPGWIGGGDAKFAAALGLWIGWSSLLPFLLIASLAGGALTLALLVLRRHPLPLILTRIAWLSRLHDPREGVPYGVALSAGALFIFPYTDLFSFTIYQLSLATHH